MKQDSTKLLMKLGLSLLLPLFVGLKFDSFFFVGLELALGLGLVIILNPATFVLSMRGNGF